MIRAAALVAIVALGGCREQTTPTSFAPASLDVLADLPGAGVAGTSAGVFTVRVTDASSNALSGVLVNFATSLGAGHPSPVADTTNADGTASTTLTLGTLPGQNQLSAVVAGLPELRSAVVTAVAGDAATVILSQRLIRLTPSSDSQQIAGAARDRFGNALPDVVTWTSRNPAVIVPASVSGSSAYARVVSRPGQAWLVATAGAASDSILVAVHDASSSACDFIATPTEVAVGATVAFESAGRVCVRSDAGAEYVLVAHYSSPVSSASATVSLAAFGITAFPAAPVLPGQAVADGIDRDAAFEHALRRREAQAIGAHLPAARAWHRARQQGSMAALAAVAREGDMLTVNVNAFDFCTAPTMRSARVMAITDGTIILEDTSNPAGGFTPDEYREMARAMDTLVLPVDTAAFGAPSDIDNNRRIGVLFTRAVNELTPRGSSGGVVLGFYYVRDLLPKTGVAGACPGSNVGEMFYVLVPDAAGEASSPRSKPFVESIVLSTIAHELQHLINASRRMYVNGSASATEETWLNEGLSHIAEELLFYRVAGISARQNIGAAQLAPGSPARLFHDLYMRGNFGRLSQYLQNPESNSPLATNDQLATRGASWSLLRYIADRIGATDGDLWRRLVNARTTGVVNLDAQLQGTGLNTMTMVRDWSAAVFMDDNSAVVSPAMSHPSWNYRSAMPQVGMSFGLAAPALADAVSAPMPLRAGGSAYLRMAIAAGKEALIQVTNNGGVPQPGVRLTLIRTR